MRYIINVSSNEKFPIINIKETDIDWLIYLIFPVLFVFTVYRVWKLLDFYRRRFSSQMWTPTTGKVIDKRIKNAARNMYYPEITYTYSVMGTEYKNKFSLGTSLLNKANSKLDDVGDVIGLRYNPLNPKMGIADREKIGAWDIYLCLAGLIVFLGVIIGLLRLSLSK